MNHEQPSRRTRQASRGARRRLVRLGAGVVAGMLSGVLAAAAATETVAPPAAGVWLKHQASFQYLGFTSTYSCDGLADQLRRLLLAAGARSDVQSQPGACASGFGRPDKFARADVTFYTLAPPESAPAAADSAAATPVTAVWRHVVLAPHSPHDLQLGDCELVEQFRSRLLPLFTTRDVVDHVSCIPHELSGSVLDLQFDSLAAAAAPGVSPPTAAAANAK
jgi:hypothetical protein